MRHTSARRLALAGLALLLTPADARAELAASAGAPFSSATRIIGPVQSGQWADGYADLGVPWLDGTGRLLYAFGDSFSFAIQQGCGVKTLDGWRQGGTLGWVDAPSAGHVAIDGMLTSAPGYAGPSLEVTPNVTNSLIPTGGASIAGYDFVHAQAVSSWSCPADGWATGSSGLYWRPTGTNQQLVPIEPDGTWLGSSNFAAAALIARGEYLYLLGTPAGRHGGVKLARTRVVPGALPEAYEYWDGTMWQGTEGNAAWIVPAPVGEFNVQFNPTFGRFVISYVDDVRAQVVLRSAPSLEGPYTEERSLYPNDGYAPFTLPFSVSGDQSLLFTLSQWCPYDVSILRASLEDDGAPEQIVTDGTFADALGSSPWLAAGTGLLVANPPSGPATGGSVEVTGSDSAWHDIHQTIAVKPNADYLLTASVLGTNVEAGSVGVRTTMPVTGSSCDGFTPSSELGSTLAAQPFGSSSGSATVNVWFNAGEQSQLDVFAGFTAPGSPASVVVQAIAVTPLEVLSDTGFEMQPSASIGWPYGAEGAGAKGIDDDVELARTGVIDAWINTADPSEWNAINQVVTVQPNTDYTLSGWVQTSSAFGTGELGVRGLGGQLVAQTGFGASAPYAQVSVAFNTGSSTSMTVFAGYTSPGSGATWMRLDDLSLEPSAPPCTAATSCAGIIDGPPTITVTCPVPATFYVESGGETLLAGSGTTYSMSTSDYAGFLVACGTGKSGQCLSFSTDAAEMCPGESSGGSSSGGSGYVKGGKGTCHGTCQ